MKQIFFTPGPSQLYPTCQTHIEEAFEADIASISHRGAAFHTLCAETTAALRALLNIPVTHRIFFVGSATEAMERIIQNCVEKHSYHSVNGAFSRLFYTVARNLGKEAQLREVEYGKGYEADDIHAGNSELICVTQNETSTGVSIPMDTVYAIKKAYPNVLLALDIVSSAPYADVDFTKVDCVFFSVQKGFGLPAGLGVLIVSPDAVARALRLEKKGVQVGSYHRFSSLLRYADKNETPETPNVLAIYLLGKIANDMMRSGMVNLRKETERKAAILYGFLMKNDRYRPFVADERLRSQTVIVAEVKNGSEYVIKKLADHGCIVGNGYKEFKGRHIRIANFPAHSINQVRQLVVELRQAV